MAAITPSDKKQWLTNGRTPIAAITSLTDDTGGTAGDTVDDTTASVKDDIASLASKINSILSALRTFGIIVE